VVLPRRPLAPVLQGYAIRAMGVSREH
jgi:hypothetical protein